MDIRLYYREEGAGFPLILLHGNGEDGSYFAHQTEDFKDQYRVIAVDTRGHGQSPRGEKPFTIRQFARDLRDFMDERGIEKAHILGFSDGGNIALVFALLHPERVDHLILNGANLDASGIRLPVWIPIITGYRWARLQIKFTELLTSGRAGAKLLPAGIRKRLRKKREQAERAFELLGLMVNDPNIPEKRLMNNRNPAFRKMKKLVIAGDRDMIKDRHTRRIAACLPNAELVILHGTHFIAKEEYRTFDRVVESFLRDDA